MIVNANDEFLFLDGIYILYRWVNILKCVCVSIFKAPARREPAGIALAEADPAPIDAGSIIG